MSANHAILWLVAYTLLTSVPLFAGSYSGGDGKATNPFQVSSVANWQELTETSADWNKHFILTTDIDLVGIAYNQAPIAQINDTFDGTGHSIRNGQIIGGDYMGLFGIARGHNKYLSVEYSKYHHSYYSLE